MKDDTFRTGGESNEDGNDAMPSDLLADSPELSQVVEEFVALLPVRLTGLQDALRKASFENLSRLAQQFGETGGQCGYEALARKLATIEESAARRMVEDVSADLDELAGLVEQIRTEYSVAEDGSESDSEPSPGSEPGAGE